jgi:hypothetical protein
MNSCNRYQAVARAARRVSVFVTPAVCSVVNAAPAWAAGGAAAASLWIGVSDTAAVPLGSYGLSLNNGSLTDPTAAPPALAMHWFYGMFLSIIGLAVWLVKNVLSFQWLKVISAPFDFIGTQLTAMVHSPAVLLAVGLTAAGVIAVTMARGKVGQAAAQVTVAVLLAYLAVALANKPVSELLGPSGALAMGRDIGVEIATELSGKPSRDQHAVDTMSASLADHFARTPTLVWNFGHDLDAAPYNCGSAWSTAITTGPIDKVKDVVAQQCPDGKALHDYAMSDPTSRKVVAFIAIIFALSVLIVFAYLCAQVVILALSAVFWAMVSGVALIAGWVPGGSQSLAIKAGLDTLFSFAGMVAMVAIVGVTGNLASAMFTAAGGDLVVAMPMVTLLLVALFVALRRVRKGLVAVRERTVRTVRRFTGNDAAASSLDATSPSEGNGPVLDRLDPLTAIPKATERLGRLTRKATAKATKWGIEAAAPEAAPVVEAISRLRPRSKPGRRRTATDSSHKSTDSSHKSSSAGTGDAASTGYEPASTAHEPASSAPRTDPPMISYPTPASPPEAPALSTADPAPPRSSTAAPPPPSWRPTPSPLTAPAPTPSTGGPENTERSASPVALRPATGDSEQLYRQPADPAARNQLDAASKRRRRPARPPRNVIHPAIVALASREAQPTADLYAMPDEDIRAERLRRPVST